MWTIKLLRFDQVPSDFREPFIVSGYRSCRSSVTTCLVSAVQRSNETLNFWTHFVPFLVFARITWQRIVDDGYVRDRFAWPSIVFLLASCFYMLSSAVAHLFNSMSRRARYIFFFFDYCGISIYSLGCCIAYYAYVFPPELLLGPLYRAYLPIATLAAIASTYLACCSRFSTWNALRESGRLPAFAIPYIWCSFPLAYRVVYCQSTGSDSDARLFHNLQFIFVMAIAFFYSTRIPESIAPGIFDIVGHSHQLFHIGTVAATYYQYLALTSDMTSRKEFLEDMAGLPTFANTFGILLAVLGGNFLVIWWLSIRIMRLKTSTCTTKEID